MQLKGIHMIQRTVLWLSLFLISSQIFGQLSYPQTKKVDQVDDYFGTKIQDPYRWLENDTARDTKEWVKTQQVFTENYMSHIPYRSLIHQHLGKILNYTRYY